MLLRSNNDIQQGQPMTSSRTSQRPQAHRDGIVGGEKDDLGLGGMALGVGG